MNRRQFLFAAACSAAGVAVFASRPANRAEGGHPSYFAGLERALREQGLARPTLLVDLDRFDRNIDVLVREIGARRFRIVAKSLPSPRLLEYALRRAGSARLMSFHQPCLNQVARELPASDVLLGKPMPIAAADRFYRTLAPGPFDPARQLQWLIDSPERLRQYRELAAGRDVAMRINVEIDVGLHRGGLREPRELAQLLTAVDEDPRVELAGLMGYDAHVAKLAAIPGAQARERARVEQRYRAFLDVIRARAVDGSLTFNAAGSPTYRLWSEVDGVANELAVGSALVKPLDFDLPVLEVHVPAAWIATPVLKTSESLAIPGLGALNRLWQLWDPNRARTFFVYGGYWMARPVSPPGLLENPVFGRSSNQEMLNGSAGVRLEVDDFVFYRPTQSESVLLQFGDLALVRAGRIVDFWPVFEERG
ncbi:DSD1 family PLP-dependent enzyme [Myxococcota bacterium]|nr:DSD1 family PLP-dependent enzyme [Myxococcota bacterium]